MSVAWCLLLVRGFVNLSPTSSQNGIIREDSSFAETFLLILIHNTKRCGALEVFAVLPALVSGTAPLGVMTRPEHTLNWDRSTPQQMLSSCYSVSQSLTPFSHCESGLVDPIYVTRQLPTGRPGRLQRSLKCEMLFLGLHRIQKWSSGENKSCCILNSLEVQWLCNQVMLLYFVFHQRAISHPENVSGHILIAAHLFFFFFLI